MEVQYKQSFIAFDERNQLTISIPDVQTPIDSQSLWEDEFFIYDYDEDEDPHAVFARFYFSRFRGDASDCRRLDDYGFVRPPSSVTQ